MRGSFCNIQIWLPRNAIQQLRSALEYGTRYRVNGDFMLCDIPGARYFYFYISLLLNCYYDRVLWIQ